MDRSPDAATLPDTVPASAHVEDLLAVTATVPMGELDSAVAIYTSEFDWVVRWSGEAGVLGEAWGIGSGRRMAYLAPEAETRGWLRLVEGPTPSPAPLSTWGWSAIEICVADVDGMMEQVSVSPHFRVNGVPVDLAISDDPPGQRAMQAVGPHGLQTFLTQVLYQIPGMELLVPPAGAKVGGIFIAVLAARSYDKAMRFYTDGLGLETKLEFEYRPTAAREHNWPEGDKVRIAALKTMGVTLIELGGYGDHAGPRPTLPGELPPAIGMASFVTEDLKGSLAGAVSAGACVVADATAVAYPPYQGRTSILVKAPGGELIELIG